MQLTVCIFLHIPIPSSSYERGTTTEWIDKNGTSPITREALIVESLSLNRLIRNLIDDSGSRAATDLSSLLQAKETVTAEPMTITSGEFNVSAVDCRESPQRGHSTVSHKYQSHFHVLLAHCVTVLADYAMSSKANLEHLCALFVILMVVEMFATLIITIPKTTTKTTTKQYFNAIKLSSMYSCVFWYLATLFLSM